MFSNPLPEFLYSAYKVVTHFADDMGTLKSIQGTGFVIAVGSGDLAIVTNRHVIDLDYKEPTAKYKNFTLRSIVVTGRRADDSLYRFSIDPASSVFYSRDVLDDVAIFIRPRCQAIENMPNTKLFYHFGLEDLADETFHQTELAPFDIVAFAGFPEEHDRLAERPLIRGGRIASDPKFNFSLQGRPAGRCIAYEAFSHGGASGSPVYAPARGFKGLEGARDGRIVGINAGHLNCEMGQHTGLSYFYRSTVILEILKDNGALTL
jgi:hypothetical protein